MIRRRPGYHSVTPRIFTADPSGLVAFLRERVRGGGEHHPERPAEMKIGDSMVMVSDGREPMPACLYVYVDDTDTVYARAVAAGAVTLEAPLTTPYGDRRAMVRDAWGNLWQIATHLPHSGGPAQRR